MKRSIDLRDFERKLISVTSIRPFLLQYAINQKDKNTETLPVFVSFSSLDTKFDEDDSLNER